MTAAERAERNERIAELAAAGRTYREIGEVFGISGATVSRVMRDRGVRREPGWPRRDPGKMAAAVADYAAGLPVADIVARHRVALAEVYSAVKAAGVPPRAPGRRADRLRDDALRRLWGSDLTVAEIAERVGMSPGGVGHAVARLDLPRRRPGRRPRRAA